jgi:hypothetical protein
MDEPEVTTTETKLKGVVLHKFLPPVKSQVSFRLLCDCVLSPMLEYKDRSHTAKAVVLQRSLRQQYFRLMNFNAESKLRSVYRLNCCPAGFDVTPVTRFCNRPQICPWCFVRRWLLPTYLALHEVPKTIRETHALVAWRRIEFNKKEPSFFASNYGPHQWCNALVTVQLGFPWLYFSSKKGKTFPSHYHVGFQIVPKSCDVVAALNRRAVSPALWIVREPKAQTESIFKVISQMLALSWLPLYTLENFEFFANAVMSSNSKSKRLLRITPYQERNTNGNCQSSVSEE